MNKLKTTILSLSVVTVMAGAAVAPALGVIAGNFPGADPLLIKLIITIPSLLIIITSLFYSVIAARGSSKTIAVAGLVFYLVGGCGAGLMNNIYLILVFRVILGIGVGLIMPLSTGLIAVFFEKKEQSKLMGYSIAMNNLGGIIATALAGYLVSLSWRYMFAIYLMGLIVLFLVIRYLPKAELNRQSAGLDKHVIREIVPYCLAMFVTMVAFFTVPTSFAIIAAQSELVPTASIGLLMSIQNITAFAAGLSLSVVLKKLGNATRFFGSGMLALAFFCLRYTNSVWASVCGLVALGIGMGTVAPILNAQITLRVDKAQAASAMAIMSAMLYLGQFLSPILIDGTQAILGLPGVQVPYSIAMILSLILFLAFFKIPVSGAENERAA